MQQELEQQITDRFPQYFEGIDPREPFAHFGFECGKGWYDLLYEMFEEFEKISDEPLVAQIKEKFGGLRVYLDPFGDITDEQRDAFFAAIQKAEDQANQTCEVCGQPGTVRGGGWLRCLCDEHNKK